MLIGAAHGPPWWLFAFPVLFVLIGLGVNIFGDRKRWFRMTGHIGRLTGPNATSLTVERLLSIEDGMKLAHAAIRKVGGRDAVVVGGNKIVAWTAAPFLGLGRHAQEVSVEVCRADDGLLAFNCSSRPRWSVVPTDFGRSRQLAQELLDVVVSSSE